MDPKYQDISDELGTLSDHAWNKSDIARSKPTLENHESAAASHKKALNAYLKYYPTGYKDTKDIHLERFNWHNSFADNIKKSENVTPENYREMRNHAFSKTIEADKKSREFKNNPTIANKAEAYKAHGDAHSAWEKTSRTKLGKLTNTDKLFADKHTDEQKRYTYMKEENMDLSKQFNKFLQEEIMGTPQPGPVSAGYTPVDDVDTNVADFSSKFVDKLNFWLKDLSNKPFINPYSSLTMLRMKLNMIGIEFNKPNLIGNYGEVNIPLLKYGGKYGQLDNSGNIGWSNGFSGAESPGFHIHLNYSNADGKWTLSGKVEKGAGDDLPLNSTPNA